MSDLVLGLRVVRGPDWCWGDQDGGEGYMGTVISAIWTVSSLGVMDTKLVQVVETDNENDKSKVVNVLWDHGIMAEYRIGFNSSFDLRVVDNSAAGIMHPGVLCDGCRIIGISGIMWQCNECPSRLCTWCMTNEKHDSSHISFRRYDRPSSHPVEVRLDRSKPTVILKGIFPGAKVKRGYFWSYDDEDGGDGSIGEVLPIVEHNEKTVGKVRVQWSNNQTHNYRLGSKGKVDLEAIQVVANGRYQPDMFPVLGNNFEPKKPASNTFSVGDKVKLSADFENLRELHGGLSTSMIKCVGQIGTVQKVTKHGVAVLFDDIGDKWMFNPLAIKRVTKFSVGELVRVRDDHETFQKMQLEFGKKTALSLGGETGRVIQFNKDGSLIDVEIHKSSGDFQVKTLNIQWVDQVEIKPQIRNKMENIKMSLSSLVVEAAAEGQPFILKELLIKYAVEVNSKDVHGRSSLHMACRRGHLDVVKILIEYNASVELEDDEGNRAVHHAAEANQLEILKLLIEKSAYLDCTNKKKLTALHLSVKKSFPECAKVLVDNQCDVNKQDALGETASHIAILAKKRASRNQVPEILKTIVSSNRTDLKIQNELGFNVLHLAVAIENTEVLKYLLDSARNKKENQAILKTILEAKTKYQGYTPLSLAIYQGNYSMIELLIEAGSDLSSVDQDGNSSIILAAHYFKRHQCRQVICELPNKESAPNIYETFEDLKKRHSAVTKYPVLAVMAYLIRRGFNWPLQRTEVEGIIDNSSIMSVLDSCASACDKQPDDICSTNTIDTVGDTIIQSVVARTDVHHLCNRIMASEGEFNRHIVLKKIELLKNISLDICEDIISSERDRLDNLQTWAFYYQKYSYKKTDMTSQISYSNSSKYDFKNVKEIDIQLPNFNLVSNSISPHSSQSDDLEEIDNDDIPISLGLIRRFHWQIEVRPEYRGADRKYIKDGLGNTYSQKKGNGVFQCTANVDQNGKKKKCRATVKMEHNTQTGEYSFRMLTQHEPHWPKRSRFNDRESLNLASNSTLVPIQRPSHEKREDIIENQSFKIKRKDSANRNSYFPRTPSVSGSVRIHQQLI